MKKLRSRAPLRLGLAGGGSDIEEYYKRETGFVLNATINLWVNVQIEEDLESSDIGLYSSDLDVSGSLTSSAKDDLSLIRDTVLWFLELEKVDFNSGVKIQVGSDSPQGSGLGTSSAIVVALLAALYAWFKIDIEPYALALKAIDIERKKIGLAGGVQDQFAASYGGFNFLELQESNMVVVPLNVRDETLYELESSIILYYTGVSRQSAKIIEDQKRNLSESGVDYINAINKVRDSAVNMRNHLLAHDVKGMSNVLLSAWEDKKAMSDKISSKSIDELMQFALENGAKSGKISGAGGGGFAMFFTEPENRHLLIKALNNLSQGFVMPFTFTSTGAHTWKIN